MNLAKQFEATLAKVLATYANKKCNRGLPYITHLIEVCCYCNSLEEKIIALLHDWNEWRDPIELSDLELSTVIVNSIAQLAKPFNDDIPESDPRYASYFWNLLSNPLARFVKWADLQVNHAFEESPCEREKHVNGEYHRVLRLLDDAKNGKLYFYSKSLYFNVFSNFYAAEFELDGRLWCSVEHYYQSQKFLLKSEAHVRIAEAQNAGEIKNIAIAYRDEIIPEWNEQYKLSVMQRALQAKFAPGTTMAEYLRQTEKLELIHQSKNDLFWGQDRCGKGENILGKIIMQIREEIS